MTEPAATTARLDKWLWIARFFKTRGLATRAVQEGTVRVNGERTAKPSRSVGPGDVLTFSQGRHVRVIRILAIGARRGPATEAQTLYADLSPAPAASAAPRPDRDARRQAIAAKRPPLE